MPARIAFTHQERNDTMKKIQVTITPDGETKIEASGYTGDECLKATKPIEDALGVGDDPRVRKFENVTTSTATKIGSGK